MKQQSLLATALATTLAGGYITATKQSRSVSLRTEFVFEQPREEQARAWGRMLHLSFTEEGRQELSDTLQRERNGAYQEARRLTHEVSATALAVAINTDAAKAADLDRQAHKARSRLRYFIEQQARRIAGVRFIRDTVREAA